MYNTVRYACLLSCTQADLLAAFEASQQQQHAAAQRQEELLRQLLATASATSGVPSHAVAGPSAIGVARFQVVRQAPRLLDYVRINSEKDGIVLFTANWGARVKVWMWLWACTVQQCRSPGKLSVSCLCWHTCAGASHGRLWRAKQAAARTEAPNPGVSFLRPLACTPSHVMLRTARCAIHTVR